MRCDTSAAIATTGNSSGRHTSAMKRCSGSLIEDTNGLTSLAMGLTEEFAPEGAAGRTALRWRACCVNI